MNNNTVDWDMQYRFSMLTLTCNSIIQLLISKGIITEDEFDKALEKIRNSEQVKDTMDKMEIFKRIQDIRDKDVLSEEDENYLRENGVKVDTKENIESIIETLKLKEKFGSIFGGNFF